MNYDVYDELELLAKRCGAALAEQKRTLGKLPYGTLYVKRRNVSFGFYRRVRNKETGIKRQPELLKDMIQKTFTQAEYEYLDAIYSELKSVVKKIEKAREKKEKGLLTEDMLGAAGLSLSDFYYSDYEKAWLSRKWYHNTSHPDHLQFVTKNGLRVRSKSERILAEFLDDHYIPYVYDVAIKINGRWVFPDFIILKPNGEWLIWEHFGMDEGKYVDKNAVKVFDYFKAGYIPMKTLFITSEENLNDMAALEAALMTAIWS